MRPARAAGDARGPSGAGRRHEGRHVILGLFRKRHPNADIIEALYERVAEAARRPAFYRDAGVPDTVEGRFEMMTLHAHLAVRRLRALPDPGGDLAQDLVDRIFAGFDAALRELGVGDISVPKRMKTLASAFLGRGKAYEQAIQDAAGEAALREAVARNVFNKAPGHEAGTDAIVRFVQETVAALDRVGFDDFVAARITYPDLPPTGAAPPDAGVDLR